MSKYLAQYLPEPILSMVTRIKEATIDVGPQPVRFAKFTQMPWEAVQRIAFKGQHQIEGGGSSMVNCLLLTTDIAFEIWLIKPNC